MAAAWACEMTALEKPWHPTSSSRQDRCRAGRRCRSWPAECARCAGCRPRRPLPGSRTRTNPRLRNPVPPSAACEKTCPTTQRRPGGFRKSPARALPPLEVGAGQLASPESRRSQLGVAPTGVVQVAAFEAAVSQLGSLETRQACPALQPLGVLQVGCGPDVSTSMHRLNTKPLRSSLEKSPFSSQSSSSHLALVLVLPLHRRTIQCLFLNGLLRRELGEIPIHTVLP